MSENRGANKPGFKLLKSIKTGSVKREQHVGFYKVYKGPSDHLIVLYKPSIKVVKPKEQLHTFNSIRRLLLLDSRDFVRIDFNSLSTNNKT